MYNNESLLLEIERFREILNYNNLLTEVIGGVADDVVDSVIKSAMRTAIKNASKETIEKAIKAGVTDLTQVLSKKELFDKVYPEVQQELLKKGMKGIDANYQKMAITTALEKNYKNVKDDLFKQVKNQASTLGTTSKTAAKTSTEAGQNAVSQSTKSASKQVAQDIVKTFKPGEIINSGSFVDSAIDWSKVTNGKSMVEYNKIIANALKTGDFSLISRGGFEKYGIDNFREFLMRGVNKEKNIMFDANKGTWYFQLGDFAKTPSKLLSDADDVVVQSAINNVKKEASQEVDEIVKLSASPAIVSPKNKSKLVNFLENKKILTVDPTTGKRKLTKRGYAIAIGLGITGFALFGALTEEGVEVDSEVQELTDTTGGSGSGETGDGSGVTGWRSLGKQYDDQIKTALGLPTDTQLTDADIDTLYNKLKENGKI